MNYKTLHYRPAKRERMLKPIFGGIAVVATLATLGLAVVGPAALSSGGYAASEHVVARAAPAAPIEVAILPGRIEVVGTRTRTTRAAGGFVPASYRTR